MISASGTMITHLGSFLCSLKFLIKLLMILATGLGFIVLPLLAVTVSSKLELRKESVLLLAPVVS